VRTSARSTSYKGTTPPIPIEPLLLLLLLLLLFKEGRILETLYFVFAITQSAFFITNTLNTFLVYLTPYEDRYDIFVP